MPMPGMPTNGIGRNRAYRSGSAVLACAGRESEAFMLGGCSRCFRRQRTLVALRPHGFAHSVTPQPTLLDGDVKQAGQPALRVIPSPRAQIP